MGCGDRIGQKQDLLLRAEEAEQRVLDFACRVQHRALIRDRELFEPRVLRPHVVADPPVVKDVPADEGRDESLATAGLELVGERLAGEPERAGDDEMRVKVGLAHADRGALRRRGHLRGAHIGSAAQQVGRDADGRRGRRARDLRRAPESRLQVARRHAEQEAQQVLRATEPQFQAGDRRLGVAQQCFRLLHVELRSRAEVEARAREFECLFLVLDVLQSIVQPLLERADRRVQRRDVAGQRDQQRVVVEHRPRQVRVGRLDAAPVAAPDVRLPGDIETRRPGVDALAGAIAHVVRQVGERRRVLAELLAAEAGGDALRLGVLQPDGDAEARARLEDPQARYLNAQILLIGLVHQRRQHGVVEDLPPVLVYDLRGIHASVFGFQPRVLGDRCRSFELRSDRRAAAGHDRGQHEQRTNPIRNRRSTRQHD